LPDALGWREQGVGVGDRAAADGVAAQDHDVTKRPHVVEAEQLEAGPPQPAPQVPGGLGKVGGGPALAHLDDADAIAFLGEAAGGDAAAEPGADDEEVEVVGRSRHPGSMRAAW
jgi:hypothetical protein